MVPRRTSDKLLFIGKIHLHTTLRVEQIVKKERMPNEPSQWHNNQPPGVMGVSLRFEYDEDHLRLLRS